MATSIINAQPVNISNGMPGLSFSSPVSVGSKAASPTTNSIKPSNTLPKSQVAQNDLSANYANVNGTIYHKPTNTAFSTPDQFFKQAGVNSFNNVKFDTAWKPTSPPNASSSSTLVQTPTPSPTSTSITPTQTPNNGSYTPPNQGTTGVSQGGIIGNLINIANKETPEVTQARQNLQDLQNANATANAQIDGRPIDLSLASGEKGILSNLFASKNAAAQTALSSALTSQGQQITANSSAGNLNAPITGVPYGTQTIQPSQPNGNTTSGAPNLSSLVGTRNGADGKTQEYFDTTTGQGFSTPQQLADFVNKQVPGINANAQNVFDILKNQGNSSLGGGSLNPLNNLSSIAADVLAGRRSLSDAQSMGGSVSAWSNYLNQELQKQSNGTFDASAAQAKYDANQTVQGNQAQIKAQYQSAQQQANNLTSQFTNLLGTFQLNPNDLNVANGALQKIAQNTSDWRYQALSNYIHDIANTYAQILTPAGGAVTDQVRGIAESMLNATASGTSLSSSLASLDQQAQAKIAGVQTPSTTGGTGGNSGSNPTIKGLF